MVAGGGLLLDDLSSSSGRGDPARSSDKVVLAGGQLSLCDLDGGSGG